jgi:hypothetical protein
MKSKDEDIVQPLLKDNGYYIIVLFYVIGELPQV